MKEAFKAYKETLLTKVADDHCGDMREHKYHMYKRLREDVVRWCDCVGTPDLTPAPVVYRNFDDWYTALDGNTKWALCGSRTAHGPHGHTVSFSFETPYEVRCGGVPEFRGTHEERFLELLKEWGIEPDKEWTEEPGRIVLVAGTGGMLGWGEHTLQVKFNEDGSFQNMGAW